MPCPPLWAMLVALCLLQGAAPGQKGDRPSERQSPVPEALLGPAAPVLSPADALAAFVHPYDVEVDLVAAEPLVGDPVAMAFDARGRLWIVEMRGYMPDPDGTGEDESSGVIAVLEDRDGDGLMDRRTVFADDLVLPRAIGFASRGVLIIEPPYLRFYEDRDGDLAPEANSIVATGLGGRYSPEHAANGLLFGIDNWIHLANHPLRVRDRRGSFELARAGTLGQWGMTQDGEGRIFFNTNSDLLRYSPIPDHYLASGARPKGAGPATRAVARSQLVRPARPTPGVNRGYQKGFLDEGLRLRETTAACSPLIYRSALFPPSYSGNAFVCEPAGNLVKRLVLREESGHPAATDAYEQGEFLASTDERFRPVALAEGPDGAIYVADLYRGLIQHRLFLTTWLRTQVEARKLDAPTGLGRVWRIRPKGVRPEKPAPLDGLGSEALAGLLADDRAFHRDTAHRLLLERGDAVVAGTLRGLAVSHPRIETRLRALFALGGLRALDAGLAAEASRDPAPAVRAAAIRLSESLPWEAAGPLIAAAVADPDPRVRRQAALSAGWVADAPQELLCDLLSGFARDGELLALCIAGLRGREAVLLDALAARPHRDSGHLVASALARSLMASEDPDGLARAIGTAASASAELGAAILRGAASGRDRPDRKVFRFPLNLLGPPPGLQRLAECADAPLAEAARLVAERVTWPGREDYAGWNLPAPTPAEERLIAAGARIFASTCAGCHEADGAGREGLGPPLARSEWVQGRADRLIAIVLHGVSGPIKVLGAEHDGDMPALGTLGDAEIASVLSYLRREFGNRAPMVAEDEVRKVRETWRKRDTPFSARELLEMEPAKDR